MSLFDLKAKITLDSSGFDQGVENASGKGKKLSGIIGKGLKTAAVAGAAGIAAAASGIAALTVGATKNFAEFEQLVGGVDTLFKSSSEKVQAYADEAYKTAGMSANEYMETVTGFSASLLQSLGGDTDAAAEKANQAVIDMSDNANKMGTDIESIQNAYGGFAKQNFTMLDNLKLGYGGTKEEMERLLADAERLSGQQYDISSYADIVDAIHVVQTEMGITGTTAAEASETISGSVSAMKSAWTNLTTGLADENADIDKLMEGFIESVGTVADNILPVVERVLKNISGAIVENLPEMAKRGAELLGKVAAGIVTAIPQLLQALPKVFDAIIQGFKEADVDWLDLGKNVVKGVWEGIKSLSSWIGDKVSGFFDTVVDKAKDLLGIHSPSKVFASIGEYMMEGLAIGMENGAGEVMETADDIIDEVVRRFSELEGAFDLQSQISDKELELWERTEGAGASDEEKFAKRMDVLTQKYKNQQNVVEAAVSAYEQAKKQYGENSSESAKYKDALLDEQLELQDVQGEIQETIVWMQKLNEETEKASRVPQSTSSFGTATAQVVNSAVGITGANVGYNEKVEVVLKSDDGRQFGRWLVPFVRDEDKSNPEVRSDFA